LAHTKRIKTDWRKATKKVWQAAQLYYQGEELPRIISSQPNPTLTEWEMAAEKLLAAIAAERQMRDKSKGSKR
jgi:hypothetical protein